MGWLFDLVWLLICAIEGEEPEEKTRDPPFPPLP